MDTPQELLDLFSTPSKWVRAFLRNPKAPEEPLMPRSYQEEILNESRTQRRIILRWGRRMGKCQVGTDKVLLSSGKYQTLSELFASKEKIELISIENNYKLVSNNATIHDNGIKDVFKLTTKSGKILNITNNTPLMTINGWKLLEDIKVGESIMIPSELPIFGNEKMDDYKIRTLAYLLADGTLIHNITLSNIHPDIKREFADDILKFANMKSRIEETLVKAIKSKGKKNEVREWLKTLGLDRNGSHTKFIPDIIFSLPKKKIRLFLSRLYACDGWASIDKNNPRTNCEIGYCSVSEELIHGVSRLLTKFGIRHSIRHRNTTCNSKNFFAWTLTIRTKEDILKFQKDINIFTKEDRVSFVAKNVESWIDQNCYFDQFPKEVLSEYSIPTSRKIRNYDRINKSKILGWAKTNKNKELQAICNSNFYFDTIKEIAPKGKEQTYFLTVPENHNYISNDVLVHNSVIMCADCLWWAQAFPLVRMLENGDKKQKPFIVRIYAPYDKHIKELWETFDQLIGDSELLKSQISRIRRSNDEHLIEFDNGSKIYGQTVGIGSQNQGIALRGQSGDLIYIDEMDYIPREIMEAAIMPIWTTHPDTILRVSSTPTGKRELFYEWCCKCKELGWFHTHHPSWHPDNDNWLSIEKARQQGKPIIESSEFQVKAITSNENYIREYGAEFSEEFGGVYKHTLIDKSIVKYGRNIDVDDPEKFDPGFQQHPDNLYILGVDWNSYVNGGQIVLVEYCRVPTIVNYFDDIKNEDVTIDFTNKYRLFYRVGIKSKAATQKNTRAEIIRLMQTMKIDFVYVDYGAGDTNIEELTHYGNDHKELKMNEKLRVIDSGAVIEHWDPILREKVKKRNKSMMVNFSVLALEEGALLLPKEEDQKVRLIGQMRSYLVKNITSRGDFSYEGPDHILDGFNLAVYGFQKEYGDLLRSRVQFRMISLADPRQENYPVRESVPKASIVAKNYSNIRDPERSAAFVPFRLSGPRLGARSGMFKSSRNIF